jgi:hypothetical protein
MALLPASGEKSETNPIVTASLKEERNIISQLDSTQTLLIFK